LAQASHNGTTAHYAITRLKAETHGCHFDPCGSALTNNWISGADNRHTTSHSPL